jgi:hypothetical protein
LSPNTREEAEKSLAIDRIMVRVDGLGREVSADRRSGLKTMALRELRQLYEDLRNASSGNQAISIIVKAIDDSQRAQRAAEDRRLDDGSGPAKTEMDL